MTFEEKVNTLFRSIPDNHDYFVISSERFDDDLFAFLDTSINYSWDSGATKVVFLLKDENYVVKVPFNCSYESEDADSEDYIPFYGADDEAEGDDYCAAEMIIYERMKKMGCEAPLLETKFFNCFNGVKVYTQKKCETLFEYTSSHKAKEDEEGLTSKELWKKRAYNYYGEWVINTLFEELDDLHSGNLGFMNDVPIIIDYAGFNE